MIRQHSGGGCAGAERGCVVCGEECGRSTDGRTVEKRDLRLGCSCPVHYECIVGYLHDSLKTGKTSFSGIPCPAALNDTCTAPAPYMMRAAELDLLISLLERDSHAGPLSAALAAKATDPLTFLEAETLRQFLEDSKPENRPYALMHSALVVLGKVGFLADALPLFSTRRMFYRSKDLLEMQSRMRFGIHLQSPRVLLICRNPHWGDGFVCKRLLELLVGGHDINVRDSEDRTCIHAAAGHGYTETCRALISLGVDVNLQSIRGTTPCGVAASGNHSETLAVLLQAPGVNVNQLPAETSHRRLSALGLAVSHGSVEAARCLLACFPAVDTEMLDAAHPGESIFHLATKTPSHGRVAEMIRALLHAGLTGARPFNGSSFSLNDGLLAACHCGIELAADVRALLHEAEIDVNYVAASGNGRTAVLEAASTGCAEVLADLFANDQMHEATITRADSEYGWTAFHFLCSTEDENVPAVELLLARRRAGLPCPDINAVDEHGRRALFYASQRGHKTTTRLLLAVPEVIGVDAAEALNAAVLVGDEGAAGRVLSRLVAEEEAGASAAPQAPDPVADADADAGDRREQQQLERPALEAVLSSTRTVPQHGANHFYGIVATPLVSSVRYDRLAIFRLLLATGSPTVAREVRSPGPDVLYGSLLHHACECGSVDVLRELLAEHGADPSTRHVYIAPDPQAGYPLFSHISPFLLACREGHVECVQAMLQHHSPPDVNARLPAHPRDNSVGPEGRMALVMAAGGETARHTEIVQLLLQAGASPASHYALCAAVGRYRNLAGEIGNAASVSLILAHPLFRAYVHKIYPRPPLPAPLAFGVGPPPPPGQPFAFGGGPPAPPIALADPNRWYHQRRRILHQACSNGNADVVAAMLDAPHVFFDPNQDQDQNLVFAPFNQPAEFREPALCAAARCGCTEVVRLLLQRDRVDVNASHESTQHCSALLIACKAARPEVVAAMLECPRVDRQLVDSAGQGALHLALLSEGDGDAQEEMVRLLLADAGVDPFQVDRAGRTPLQAAESAGRAGIAAVLRAALAVRPQPNT